MNQALVLDLVEQTGTVARGTTITVRLDADDLDRGTELVSEVVHADRE
ncbi:MAG: hypothetical protein ABR615_01495 [Pseudonocardiaceae bacterium]